MNAKSIALLGGAAVIIAAIGVALFSQNRGAPDGLEAGPPPVSQSLSEAASAGASVPEAALVHEGSREAIPVDRSDAIQMTVYASPTCGCCSDWVSHAEENGFEVEVVHRNDMGRVKEELGLPVGLASCHTGVVNGYVVEGHVPAEDLRRFLAEAPEVRGLTVPGMPVGAPGMEVPTGQVDEYDVLTFTAEGETTVYASYRPGTGE
ncbi:MAG: DUF411 domain-containing protein [Gemmatimonadota bacterium]